MSSGSFIAQSYAVALKADIIPYLIDVNSKNTDQRPGLMDSDQKWGK
jgi:hypothetical protein